MSLHTDGLKLEAAQRSVLAQAYRKHGESLIVDPATLDTPLQRVLDHETEVAALLKGISPELKELLEERVGEELEALVMRLRVRTFMVLLDWLAGDPAEGPLPRTVLQRFYAFARAVSPDHIWRMNQAEVGRMFGETRAATCEREKQMVEAFMRLWNMKSWISSGGKSASARDRYSRDKQGNHCRKGGKSTDHIFEDDEDGAELRDGDFPKRPELTAKDLREMRDKAERQRLATMCGVRPEDIDLEKSNPNPTELKKAS